MNFSVQKIWALETFPKTENGDFLEAGFYDFV
jgi:hypothetical protein